MFLPPMQGYCHLCIFPVSLSKEQDFRYWKLSELTRQSKRRTKEDRHRLKRLKSITYHLMRRNQSRQLRTALRFTHQTFTVFFFYCTFGFYDEQKHIYGNKFKTKWDQCDKDNIIKKKKVCLRKTKITACHTDPLEVLWPNQCIATRQESCLLSKKNASSGRKG